jgi:hypothetical protein
VTAVSGASIIALSFILTAAVCGSSLMLMRRTSELGQFLDELDETTQAAVRGQLIAARIGLFKAKALRERSLS